MPANSRSVDCAAVDVVAWAEFVTIGEARASEIRHAIKRTVRGEGEGIEEEGCTRWICRLKDEELGLAFSSELEGVPKMGMRHTGALLACVVLLISLAGVWP